MGFKQTTAPATALITTADAKEHCRVTAASADDNYIDLLVSAATTYCEDYTGRQFITATWTWDLDEFPISDCLLVPISPLIGVTSLKYLDSDGVQQTWGSGNYDLDVRSTPGRIALAYNIDWPTIRGGEINSVEVIFTAGYGTATTDVPENYIQAAKLLIAHWYITRQEVMIGEGVKAMPIPKGVNDLLNLKTASWIA